MKISNILFICFTYEKIRKLRMTMKWRWSLLFGVIIMKGCFELWSKSSKIKNPSLRGILLPRKDSISSSQPSKLPFYWYHLKNDGIQSITNKRSTFFFHLMSSLYHWAIIGINYLDSYVIHFNVTIITRLMYITLHHRKIQWD